MKKILITGVNSYVGNSLADWLAQYPNDYEVHKISVRGDNWKQKDFSIYDSIVHVAGVAHVSRNPKMEKIYYRVNRDLTVELAKKAKKENVTQFIFMSSIIVYGEKIENNGVIDENTDPNPTNFYGKSKLEAEEGIKELQDNDFNVVIIRPPMIYGKGSKGNYPKLAKLARISPTFPDIDNKRSMLHIENLNEFLKLMIDNNEEGMFFPQNKEYVQTSEMVKLISETHGKKMRLTKLFNFILNPLRKKQGIFNKLFGDLVYEQKMSQYLDSYYINDLNTSIRLTERM